MNIKTVIAARNVKAQLDELVLRLHWLTYGEGVGDRKLRHLFNRICDARDEAGRVLRAVVVEFDDQLEEIASGAKQETER